LTLGAGKTVDGSPSVDRINPNKGYTPENCWIISHKANRIKSNATVCEIRMVAEGLENKGYY
ncbi:unnamed protein product, partial [marine sediment metagenome]